MLTLLKSTGNEFSHEIGHHFGLGHYPGKYQHGSNCCWGYIGHLQRMRANLNWETDTIDSGGGFRGMYSYVKSPMAGGGNYSKFSKYTYYTGYDVKNEIIPSLNSPVFSSQSSTGYRKWKDGVERMEDYRPKTPSSEEVWYNSEDGKYRVPKRQGVKVFSILGGYDPTEGVGLLYPPARSNWGNVFDLPAPDEINSSTRQCWLSVDYEAKNSEEIALAPKRLGSQANKLHVQIAVDQNPEKAQLYCQEPGRDAQLLSKTSFPQNLESIEDPVVIGQENEYEAYEEVE
jgi:hypothetical protein